MDIMISLISAIIVSGFVASFVLPLVFIGEISSWVMKKSEVK